MHRLRRLLGTGIVTLAGLGLAAPVTPAMAQPLPVTTRTVKFAVTAAAANGLSDAELSRRLALYVEDVNAVFAKNTRRRFSFDPTTGVTVVPDWLSFPDSATTPEFDILLIDAVPFPGTAGIAGGAQVELYGITRVLDPSDLSAPQDADDYLRYHLANLLHELEHTHKAGNREYYLDLNINDTSNRAPLIPVTFQDVLDPYWSARREFAADPLAMSQYDNPFLGTPKTRADVLAATRFTRVTADTINRDWSAGLYPFPSSVLTVKLVDKVTGAPIAAPGQFVVYISNPNFTLTSGQTVPFTSGDAVALPYLPASGQLNQLAAHRRLIKAYVPGYAPAGGWHTINDQYEDLFIDGKPTGDLVIRMSPDTAPGPEIGLVEPPAGADSDPNAPTLLRVPASASQGLKTVEVRQDGAAFATCATRFAESTTSTVFECAPIFFAPVGTVLPFTITVTDWAGKTATATTSFTVVDRTGPDGDIFPAGRTLVHSGEVVLLTTQFSDMSGVASLELLQRTGPTDVATVLTRTFAAPYDTQQLEIPWTVPDVFAKSTGQVQLTLRLRDALGNSRDWSITLGVDNVKPVVRLVAPDDDLEVYPGDVVDFTVEATDNLAVDYMEVFAFGQSLCYNGFAPYTCPVTIPATFRGNTDFVVRFFDVAGNQVRRTVRVKVRHH